MKKYKKSNRYYYFVEQKIYGMVLIVAAVLSAILTEGDITAAALLGPLGLCLFFTKKCVIADDYFYEMEEKSNRKDRP